MTPEDVDRVWEQEKLLLTSEVRGDPQALSTLLGPDFHEIGQSGRHWKREDLIAAVSDAAGQRSETAPEMDEQRADVVASDLVLLTYRLQFEGRVSRRSSLWRQADGALQMVFHQGTPLP